MRASALLRQLDALLARYDGGVADDKLRLLAAAARLRPATARELRLLQRAACFLQAFPDDARVLRAARALAAGIAAQVAALPRAERAQLDDSGTAGSVTRHVYALPAAQWLARHAAAEIDWAGTDAAALAPLAQPLLDPLEDEYTEFDARGLRDWIARAKGSTPGGAGGSTPGDAVGTGAVGERGGARGSSRRGASATDLQWLLAQAPAVGRAAFARAWAAAEVQLAWPLRDSRMALARNRWPRPVHYRRALRKPLPDARAAITQPLAAVDRLPRAQGARLLAVWRAALWSRTRTVFQIEQPNLDEVWLCDLGVGLEFAAIGVRPALRGTLETTYGHLLLANGMPIGYGGFTPLFAQVNTGINVFPEYRGAEAAFAWQQALRAMHTLTACAHFIVNPYQFGAGNDEALASGAYWFYWRLGFRSVDARVRALAEAEAARLRAEPRYRVPLPVLRRLAGCDLRLDLADGTGTLFDEAALGVLARNITAVLAREPAATRAQARVRLTARIAAMLGVQPARWNAAERAALAQFAPLLAQIDDLAQWPAAERAALVALVRARAAPVERDYVLQARAHVRLRESLARAARASSRAPA